MSDQQGKHQDGGPEPGAGAAPPAPRKKGGPATQFGRQISAQNSLVHGFRSARVILPGESQQEFDAFYARLLKELAPEGAAERLAADAIVAATWRLRRLGRIESELFKHLYDQDLVGRIEQRAGGIPDPTVRLGANVHFAAQRGMSFQTLQRYEAHLERTFYAALTQLHHMQAQRLRR